MPEINENKIKCDNGKKGSCCSDTCCLFPSYGKRSEGDEEGENAGLFMMVPTDEPTFIDDLPKDLTPGTCISLCGFVKPECSRFAINLLSSKDLKSDIAVHINPRLSQRYVVRNCRINGRWGDEETTSMARFELWRNKKFDLDIMITEHEFLVSINGKHVCAFVFRIPLSRVKVVQVEGAVEVNKAEYRKLQIYPSPSPENVPFTVPLGDGDGQGNDSTQQLVMPVTALLPQGFQQGWQLEIYGRVKILPCAFYINLQEGAHIWPHPTVYLHLNPRFSTMHGKHLFIRNARIDGEWGQEERTAGFQFSPASPFSVAIRKSEDHFSVWVDGQLAGEFKFRGPADRIDTVYIQGDVVIKYVYMRKHIDDKYFTKSSVSVKL